MGEKKQITVRRCARPIIHRKNSDKVVLGLHGYTGYPGQLAYPAIRFVQEGWDVFIPRLSGHGTCGNDMKHSSIKHMRRQVADEFINLQASYKHVCVLGHSMGGLLALDLALYHKMESLTLMAPCIGFYPKDLFLIRLTSFFAYRTPRKWEKDPESTFFDDRDDDDDDYLGNEYRSWQWTRILADLFSLEKKIQGVLSEISVPVLGIFAKEDQTTGYAGLEVLQNGLAKSQFRGILLDRCSHQIPHDKFPGNKEKAMDLTLEWFGNSLIT